MTNIPMTPEEKQQEIERLIATLHTQLQVTEYDFPSTTPVFGKLIRAIRLAWNSISTRWYVRDYARQQLEFQHTLIQLLQHMQQSLQQSQQNQIQSLQNQVRLEQQVSLLKIELAEMAEKNRRLNISQQMLERDIATIAQHRIDHADV